jgi:hypothetical protein
LHRDADLRDAGFEVVHFSISQTGRALRCRRERRPGPCRAARRSA